MPGRLTLRCAAYAAVLTLAAGCGSVQGEPTAESPAPSPQPTPATTTPASTSTPPETPMPPGRQPPLSNASDVEVLEAPAGSAGVVADAVAQALTSYNWTVTRLGDTVVGVRTDVQPVTPGRRFHVVTASLDSPAGLGLLLTLAHALRSRSTHLPTVFVAEGGTSYAAQLDDAARADAVPIELSVPEDASPEDVRALAVELIGEI